MKFLDFFGHDDTAPATKHLDMPGIVFLQHIDDVLKVLYMPTLVRTDGNALHIFLQCRLHYLGD